MTGQQVRCYGCNKTLTLRVATDLADAIDAWVEWCRVEWEGFVHCKPAPDQVLPGEVGRVVMCGLCFEKTLEEEEQE